MAERCHDWPLGVCLHGADCLNEHHRNLDPYLPVTIEHEFDVPNTVGDACVSCVQQTRPVSLRLSIWFSRVDMV